jgi:hypothetical protein
VRATAGSCGPSTRSPRNLARPRRVAAMGPLPAYEVFDAPPPPAVVNLARFLVRHRALCALLFGIAVAAWRYRVGAIRSICRMSASSFKPTAS